jgi:hypothetical protein
MYQTAEFQITQSKNFGQTKRRNRKIPQHNKIYSLHLMQDLQAIL